MTTVDSSTEQKYFAKNTKLLQDIVETCIEEVGFSDIIDVLGVQENIISALLESIRTNSVTQENIYRDLQNAIDGKNDFLWEMLLKNLDGMIREIDKIITKHTSKDEIR